MTVLSWEVVKVSSIILVMTGGFGGDHTGYSR